MNIGIYRLVYNTSRGMWMAVGEHVRSHQSGKNSTKKSGKKANKKASLTIIILGLQLTGLVGVAFADPNALPIDLQAVSGGITQNYTGNTLTINQALQKGIMQGTNFNIGANAAVNFNHTFGAGAATLIRINGSKSVIDGALNSPNGSIYLINQNGILFGNGARINVGGLVASALNISDADFLNKDGHLTAAIENKGRAAYVWEGDAAGFKTALIQIEPDAQIKAALGGSVLLFAPTVINKGSIETTQGQVAMAAGDKVYLSFAPKLNEAIAGSFDYADDSAYRGLAGLLVEVDSYKLKPAELVANGPTELTGQVSNDVSGRVLAQRGNVTMASFLVNQNGRVTATSSATQKGSIRLLARDTKTTDTSELVYAPSKARPGEFDSVEIDKRLTANNVSIPNTLITGSRTGKLNIGTDSVTTILAEDKAATYKAKELFNTAQLGEPAVTEAAKKIGEKSYLNKVLAAVDVNATTITDEQIFNPPTLETVGRQVTIGDNAKIVVPGGFVKIAAQNGSEFGNASSGASNLTGEKSRLYIGKNALIDASGLQNVAVNLERNFVEALLTFTDLKDNPINRNEFLYREKVTFDIRDLPDPRVADLAGFVKQVPRSIGEKLAEGGAIKLQSEGDLIQSAGSKIDVSGGSLQFATGINKETWLVAADGKSYALGNAPVDTLFVDFLGGTSTRKVQEAGYIEGKGSRLINGQKLNQPTGSSKQAVALQIDAYNIVLDGQLQGSATYGQRQRESGNLMAQLQVNVLTQDTGATHGINIGNTVPLGSDFNATTTLPAARVDTVQLDANMLSNSGFEDIAIKTEGDIKVNNALNLAAGAKLALTAGGNVDINKNITARGGNIELTSGSIVNNFSTANTNITLANNTTLDVSGNWVNDNLAAPATGRVLKNGGKVSIKSADDITLGEGSLVDVSGGAWLYTEKGEQKLAKGNAGSIDIASQVGQGTQDNPFTYIAPQLNGSLRGFALGTGGNLSITAPFITIGDSGFADARDFLASPEFFQTGGFTGFSLTGRDGVLVKANTQVDVVAKNYVLNSDYRLKQTGAHVHDFATTTVLPSDKRSSTSVELATKSALGVVVSDAFTASGVSRGSIVVEKGASIKVDSNGIRTAADGKKVAPKIALKAWDNQINVDGTLQALGGDISLTMNGDPTKAEDNGYNAAQAIWLGKNAKLLAGGYTSLTPNNDNLTEGTVYDGGKINIDAKKGYVVANAGSVIDVSGTSATLDIKNLNRITATKIASSAGDVIISAREGMLLDSTLKADSPGALGGTLEVRLTRGGSTNLGLVSSPYPGSEQSASTSNPGNAPNQLWYIDVAQTATFVPTDLDVGESVQLAAGGLAKITADTINKAGFSEVGLKSEHGVRFTGDVDLTATRAIDLNAKVIEAAPNSVVKLSAPNVVLSNVEANVVDADGEARAIRPTNQYSATNPIAGNAQLLVNAGLVDFKGPFALSGFASQTFNSTGDIRLSGISNPQVVGTEARQSPVGQLVTTGTLNFNARQVYATSLSDFTVSVNGTGSTISINKINPNNGFDKVLSAGSKLTLSAETINQNGVLLAPFGTINLSASKTLNLNAGSMTSVSAQNALIPFGFTQQDGKEYLYDFGAANKIITAPPERIVNLNAPNLNQNPDSVIDISGGGDLLAYEWVPGIGGSSDVLAADANQNAFGKNTTNTWAIMPANNQTFASFDPQYWQGSDVKAGDAVYISGAPGIAAGYYTLLPARYALLPGAVLVSAVSGYQDRAAGQTQTLANGSTLVSGHLAAFTHNGYAQTTRTGGFVVRPGSDANKLAQYNTTKASNYFKANTQAQQTIDAGRLSIAATENLVLKGTLTALHSQLGLGAEVDIAAPRLLVVGAGEAAGQVTLDGKSYLAIDETTLANFNAASLLLGATRSNGNVDVVSSEVRMNGNADLVGPEITLAATDTVRLESGAKLTGIGNGATAKKLTIGAIADKNGNFDGDGDGALVSVSGAKAIQTSRINSNADRGDLIVEANATITAAGAVLLDATKSTQLMGDINIAQGAALAFASSHISLGAPDNGAAVTDGLWLQKAQIDQFVAAGSLSLKSQSSIDIYGDTTFGNNNFDLTLQSAGLAGYQNAGKSAIITARNLTLANDDNATFTAAAALSDGVAPTLGTGNLTINAQTVTAGNNTVRLAGYDQVDITASKEIVAAGNAPKDINQVSPNKLVADKNLTLSSAQITTAEKADYAIEAGAGLAQVGLLTLQGTTGAQPAGFAESKSQGTKLALIGDSVLIAGDTSATNSRHAAAIVVKGGQVSVEATGDAATDNVTIQDGASVNVQGSAFVLNKQTVNLPAGKVIIASKNGDINVQQGALIDLSASGNGDAGQLVVTAINGQANLGGSKLLGTQQVGGIKAGKNATAHIDAKTMPNVSQNIATLNEFAGAQLYRVRSGDVTVAANDSVKSKKINISADDGFINVNGKLDASGDKGGSIEIFAKNDVAVNRGAQLLAKGLADTTSTAGTLGNGGDITLSSQTGIVKTDATDGAGLQGALIDVGGDQVGSIKGENGEVNFIATRTGASTGASAGDAVNVDSKAAAAVIGAKRVNIGAVKQYNYTTVGTLQQNIIRDETNTFVANIAPQIAAYSPTRDGLAPTINPVIQINSASDLTISNDWILANTIPSGGELVLRAAGNLNINGSLDYEQFASNNPVVQRPNTWNYRLIAGADASSANSEAVIQGNGDLNVANNKLIRTGTGFIHATVGKDINLGSAGANGAAIYTLGLPDNTQPAGFTNFTTTQARELHGDGGGEVRVYAGGNIKGSETEAAIQDVNNWLYQAVSDQTSINPQARWFARYQPSANPYTGKGFVNGIGTLGGGDVDIVAGGTLSNLQVVSASNGRMGGDKNQAPDIKNLSVLGGGDINVNTGGSISQVLLHAGKGDISAQSAGDLSASLSLMNSTVSLQAKDTLTITSASNPTIDTAKVTTAALQAKFYTYSENTSINALSLAGGVEVKATALAGKSAPIYPANLLVAAPNGDINVNDVTLFPSKTGNATLLSGKNINIAGLIISDVDPSALPTVTTPLLNNLTADKAPALANFVGASGHTQGSLHAADVNPVRIYAANDVSFSSKTTDANGVDTFQITSPLISPKSVQILAGNDIVNPNVIAQNLSANDVSVIEAGKDIYYTDAGASEGELKITAGGIQIAGPGRLHVLAGEDIDLGTSQGVRSVGNLYNPFLSTKGADLLVQAGAAAKTDVAGILKAYVDPSSIYSILYLPQLTKLMQQRTGNNTLNSAQALADFKLLDSQSQTAFINQVYFAELNAGALDAKNSGTGDYSRSLRAILTMFPEFAKPETTKTLLAKSGSIMADFEKIASEEITHPGNLSLFYSQIKSESGGAIETLTPGGFTSVGLAVPSLVAKPDSDLGIVSLRGGNLNGFARNDFSVNTSRIFTLGGSDLFLFSALNDIDAGKGSKTASSTPPPLITIVNGQVIFDFSGAVTGSGIGGFVSTGGKPGEVNLYAPYGEINAGEAGIRSAGNINLGARVIVGADNISAGGAVSGAPVASAAGLSVSAPASSDPTSQSKQSDQAAESAKAANNKLAALPSLITVEVIALGDESAAPTTSPNTSNKPCKESDKNKKDCKP